MRITPLVAILASTFVSYSAQAADLLQIYKDALANDPVFASAAASKIAGDEKVVQGRAGLLPQIGLSGGWQRGNQKNETTASDSISSSYVSNSYSLNLTQPLFHMQNWEQYEQGKLQTMASATQFEQAKIDLILRVAQAYFDVLTAQDTLSSVQANKVAITEQLASAKRNFEVGTTTITDTHEAQARYDLAVANEYAALNDLEIKRTALQQITGKAPGDIAALRPGVKLTPPLPAVIDKWVDAAEHQNYSVMGQQLNLELAQRSVKFSQAGHYPTVDFTANHQHGYQGGSTITNPSGTSTGNSIGIQWSIPIYAGNSITSKVRESIALEDKARNDLESARRTAAQNARQSFLGVSNGLAQVTAYEAAEVSSQSALDSNKLGYQVGVRINIDVLNAQQQLYTNKQNLAKARYDTIVNGLRLKAAAGSLKEEDLSEINSLLVH